MSARLSPQQRVAAGLVGGASGCKLSLARKYEELNYEATVTAGVPAAPRHMSTARTWQKLARIADAMLVC